MCFKLLIASILKGLIAGIRYEVIPATHDRNNTDDLAYGVLEYVCSVLM